MSKSNYLLVIVRCSSNIVGTNNGTNIAAKEQRMVVLTTVRRSLAPYLPPPVLKGLYNTDVYFHLNHNKIISHDQFEDEPSMAILSALFVAYIVLRSIQGLWLTTTKRSTVHLSGEEDTVLAGLSVSKGSSSKKQVDGTEDETPTFKETVVICGASNSGKTALLHSLCDNTENSTTTNPPMTVTSLSANIGYVVCPWEDANDNTNSGNMTIRVIDYPGHPSLLSQLTTLLLASATSRLVFTIDTTQPVTEAASLMYQYILTHSQVRQSWAKVSKTLEVLVVCTKTDAKGAKNYKRMKIQLRNELDKLRKVDMAIKESSAIDDDNDSTKTMLQVKGKSIDLDNLGLDVPVSLHFVESGFGGKAMEEIRDFVVNGKESN